jgi:hypothetical protein
MDGSKNPEIHRINQKHALTLEILRDPDSETLIIANSSDFNWKNQDAERQNEREFSSYETP